MRATVRWFALAAIPIVLLSMLPQILLWAERGSQWNGAYAVVDGDEFLYSAYINALLGGRPRRNDPFSGRDDHPRAPMQESGYSINVVPAFVISSLAKVCGVSASTAFIVLIGMAGLLATAAVFWLVLSVTGDLRIAAMGSLLVICFGGPAAGQGLLGIIVNADVTSLGFPFLRRYQPSATFSLFFVFVTLIWRALVVQNNKRVWLHAALGGVVLGALVFSYFYLWTTAVAWFTCCTLWWLYFRPIDRARTLKIFAIVSVIALFAIGPYMYLLSNRSTSLDESQMLVSSHRPDLFRVPEIIGALVLASMVMAVRRHKLEITNRACLFAASLAALPFVVFNQQVITGKSLQPFHFETFIVNYAVLVSVVILVAKLRHISSQFFRFAIALCLLWGIIEVTLPARARYQANVINDEMVPALRRLKELSISDGTQSGLRHEGKTPAVVFSPHTDLMRLLPTWTAQGILLGVGSLDFGSGSRRDPKVYLYLYYCGVTGQSLRELLQNKSEDTFMNLYARGAIFGLERVRPKLTSNYKPIQDAEIEEQVRLYETYVASFTPEAALKHPIAYVVVRRDSPFDFSRIDLWYQRGVAEPNGVYDLFRLSARNY